MLVPLQQGTEGAFLLANSTSNPMTMTRDASTPVHARGGSHESNYCGRVASALPDLATTSTGESN